VTVLIIVKRLYYIQLKATEIEDHNAVEKLVFSRGLGGCKWDGPQAPCLQHGLSASSLHTDNII
jgi:hypothetical protein